MATCFKNISNKLCCTSYFKSTHTIHVENSTFHLRKQVRFIPPKDDLNALCIAEIQQISTSNQLCCFSNVFDKKSDLIRYSGVTSYDFNTQYRRVNELNNSCVPFIADSKDNFTKTPNLNSKVEDKSAASVGRPSEEQLEIVYNELRIFLPRLFSPNVINAELYHKDIILENRIRGTCTTGLYRYVAQLALLKVVAHVKFAYVRFEVLKITKHPEDGTIRCRWRINGLPGMSVIFQFWKLRPTMIKNEIDNAPIWYDGFSTYYVSSDGKIQKHVIDKMMPDDDKVVVDKSIASKVALCLGLLPPEQQKILMSMVISSSDNSSYLSQVMLPLEKISRGR